MTSDRRNGNNTYSEGLQGSKAVGETSLGRWPANLIHDGSPEVVGMFPNSKTARIEKPSDCLTGGAVSWDGMRGKRPARGYDGDGSSARFFQSCPPDPEPDPLVYCPKASRKDRNEGCESIPEVTTIRFGEMGQGPQDKQTPRAPVAQRNGHPCVKPNSLCRYLVRLITPPGGTCLDPFMGSGSTGKAAVQEGFGFIGIEREPEYLAIARARIAAALRAASPTLTP